jgi:hypothetical protein
MKRTLITALLATLFSTGQAQQDLSGAYGFALPAPPEAPAPEKNKGLQARLVLLRMEGSLYRFWLDVQNGWPGYHVGETDGTISFKNDTASFDNTFEDATHPCILGFRLMGNTLRINSHSTSFNCGFGQGVHADGDYARLPVQPVLNQEWLEKEYGNSPYVRVHVNRAELFRDETGRTPFSPRRYLVKDTRIMSIGETENMIYTELIPAAGQFTWGWLRKTELTPESR